MTNQVEAIVQDYMGVSPSKITSLGGGFYGRVFLAEIPTEPQKIVVKLYLFHDLAPQEAKQLEVLSKYAIVPMPKVLYIHYANENTSNDAIVMSYIQGHNVGNSGSKIREKHRLTIANQIIDNLIAYHSAVNPNGFGHIGASSFFPEWKDFYRIKADSGAEKAKAMYKENKIDRYIFETIQKSHALFDKIFYLPIAKACLIHGDYNTWNILMDSNFENLSGAIDPFGCCWADSELDLYQLNNANGKQLGLLDLYKSKIPLSENFELKMSFYELYSEITHFHDAGVNINHSQMTATARQLRQQIEIFGLE